MQLNGKTVRRKDGQALMRLESNSKVKYNVFLVVNQDETIPLIRTELHPL